MSFECFPNPQAASHFPEQPLHDAHRFLSKRQHPTVDQVELDALKMVDVSSQADERDMPLLL
jgi:hypothetical protein